MILFNAITNSRVIIKHGTKLAWAAAALCCIAVAWHVGSSIHEQNKIKAANYAPQTIAPINTQRNAGYQANDIVSANLFGNPTPIVKQEKVAKTTLNLTLEGVLAASDDSLGRAIIKSGNKPAKLYSIGEEIQGAGASLKEIRNQEVLLNRNGATESLALKKLKGSSKGSLTSFGSAARQQPASEFDNNGLPAVTRSEQNFQRSTPKPPSPNGQPRKIRKPNFSGLDRALEKIGEL